VESNRQLDAAGRSRGGAALISVLPRQVFDLRRASIVAALLVAAVMALGQQPPSPQQLDALRNQQRWSEIVRALGPVHPRSAEMEYAYGIALAHLGRWSDAERALEDGRRLAPRDPRFPVELAGVAYKQQNNARAERLLHDALRLGPHDAYANDFLATLYFLDENLEAALKYWNRVGKPQIAMLRKDPRPQVSASLLDHAFAFAPQSTLLLPQYLTTQRRLRGLGIFPAYQIDLAARGDGRFDAVFRARELDGFGGGGWTDALMFLRGAAFQEVNPSYWNLRRQAINFDSMFRWDAEKRRIYVIASGPLLHGARYRWRATADLRNENWAIVPSFTGSVPLLAAFKMRTARADLGVVSYASGRMGWSTAAELSHRDFRSVNPGSVLTPQMLAAGYELKQRAQLDATLWRVPEHRFTLNAGGSAQAARLWSTAPESFGKFAGSLSWQWLPQRRGDDYGMTQEIRAGRIVGQAPLDELYILGLERDNNLPMHAHIGTRDGRKGSAPLGREYFLQNWQLDKNLYSNGLIKVQAGPLLDIGRIADPGAALGSHQWMFDTGAQLKLRVLGSGLVFSYGRDLRTGNNALYVMLLE
jgi:tetratricopeptide (TPR) repeat protein